MFCTFTIIGSKIFFRVYQPNSLIFSIWNLLQLGPSVIHLSSNFCNVIFYPFLSLYFKFSLLLAPHALCYCSPSIFIPIYFLSSGSLCADLEGKLQLVDNKEKDFASLKYKQKANGRFWSLGLCLLTLSSEVVENSLSAAPM